ncbi:MAG: endonuclease/exonuclease/phosphatase family protein [Armatimonadota bacterium]|nr:endonuclease/exonuclease/phosphatase family protein [Armatimonadota bacterium]
MKETPLDIAAPYLPPVPPVPRGYFAGRWARRVMLLLSVGLCLALAYAYATRPDAAAAVTVFPVWAWLAPGLLLTLAGWSPWRSRAAAAVFLLWVTFLAAFAEEPLSLLRARHIPTPPAPHIRLPDTSLRVVSLNCSGGREDAAREALSFHPDVLLLQEAPGRGVLHRLLEDLFAGEGGMACAGDTAVLARGVVRPMPPAADLAPFSTSARVVTPRGAVFFALSLHLTPPVAREDLWNPDCWREQRENRRARAKQTERLAAHLARLPGATPLLVGGDWNAPAGDAVYRPLHPRLHDTFAAAGVGWGNTVLNDFPVLRIDAIWASHHFRPVGVFARPTRHSDHRLVVCDLRFP